MTAPKEQPEAPKAFVTLEEVEKTSPDEQPSKSYLRLFALAERILSEREAETKRADACRKVAIKYQMFAWQDEQQMGEKEAAENVDADVRDILEEKKGAE